jgi:hypothetical protein
MLLSAQQKHENRKRRQSALRFFSPSDEVKALEPNIMKTIKEQALSRLENPIAKGIKGINYRGFELYYVAFNTQSISSTDNLAIAKARYQKSIELKQFLEMSKKKHELTSKALHGTGYESFISDSLTPQTIKARIKRYLKDYHNAKNAAVNPTTFYCLFTVKPKKYNFDKGFEIHASIVNLRDLKNTIKAVWSRSVVAIKAKDRERARTITAIDRRRTQYGHYQLVGGVHVVAGEFIRLHNEKIRNILNFAKKPMSNAQHVGIEIEASVPEKNWDKLKELLGKTGFAQFINMGTDGSVTSNDFYKGAEIRLCIPTLKVEDVINAVCAALLAVKARVDRSCGLHVHLDARDVLNVDHEQMFKNLVRQQLPLYLTQPASRRGNRYCKWTFKDDLGESDRYKTINPESYDKYQTIEVRLHSGTIIADKIIKWTRLLEAIAYGKSFKNEFQTVEGLLNALVERDSITESTKDYFIQRAAKFKKAPKPIMSADSDDYREFTEELLESDHENEEEWPIESFGAEMSADDFYAQAAV